MRGTAEKKKDQVSARNPACKGIGAAPAPNRNHPWRWTPDADKGPEVPGRIGLSLSLANVGRWRRKAVLALSGSGERSARAPLSRRNVRRYRPVRCGLRPARRLDKAGCGWPMSDSTPGRQSVRCGRPRAWSRARPPRARDGATFHPAHPARARDRRARRVRCTPQRPSGPLWNHGVGCDWAT